MLRICWKDKKINENILEELDTGRNLLSVASKRKLMYAGYTIRNKNTNIMKIVLQGNIEGKHERGRPATSVIDNIIEASG